MFCNAATNNNLGVVTPVSCKELWIAHSQRLQSITSLGVATPNDYNSLHVLGVATPNAYNSLHVLEWLLPTITIHYKRLCA